MLTAAASVDGVILHTSAVVNGMPAIALTAIPMRSHAVRDSLTILITQSQCPDYFCSRFLPVSVPLALQTLPAPPFLKVNFCLVLVSTVLVADSTSVCRLPSELRIFMARDAFTGGYMTCVRPRALRLLWNRFIAAVVVVGRGVVISSRSRKCGTSTGASIDVDIYQVSAHVHGQSFPSEASENCDPDANLVGPRRQDPDFQGL